MGGRDWAGAKENFAYHESFIMTWLCYPKSFIGLALLQRELQTPGIDKSSFKAIILLLFHI